MGELHHFLGVKVVQDHNAGNVWIGQEMYTENILRHFGMDEAKSIRTPVDANMKLVQAGEEDSLTDQSLYHSAVGSLMYLHVSTATTSDIMYAVNNVAKFCARPTGQHWVAVKCIFRYLKGIQNYGLLYRRSNRECVGYADADWGRDLDDQKSTSGYVLHFQLLRQNIYLLLVLLKNLYGCNSFFSICRKKPTKPMVIFEDDQSAISLAKNHKFHGRSQHIAIKYHSIQEQVNSGKIELRYCKMSNMIGDFLTNGLNREKLRLMAGVTQMINTS